MNIKLLRRQGMSIRAIARTTGLSRQSVRRALKQTVPSTYKPRPAKPAKLDPFKDHLRSQLDLRPWISAAQLYRELLPKGFSGHYELVKTFCRSERQLLKARQNACVRFETAPGLEAQFDWKGPVTGLLANDPQLKLYFFRLLLGYSRFRITRVVSHITLPDILADLSDVLTQLGGVPQRIVFDNFKAAVITPRPNLRLHPFFADFCSHFGFEPAPAFPYSPQRKGKTERSFRDLESSDLLHQTCSDISALQLQLTLDDLRHASTIHSSTGERPSDRLDRERPFLHPLPVVAFDPRLPQTRKVLSDCTISFEGAYYSVPWKLVGKRVTVKADARKGVFDVFDGATLIVTHTTVAKGERVIIKEHIEELIRPRWERARRGEGGTRSPHNTASPIRQMVVWPEVEVTDRPLSQYQKLIEEVSK